MAPPGSIRAARAMRTAISTTSTGPGTRICGPTSLPRSQLPTESTRTAPTGPRLTISIVNRQLTNPVVLSYEATPALVTRNVELTANGSPGTRSTRHLEVALPAGMQYRAGDHLGVLPRNSLALIRRVMRHFKLDAGMYLTIAATSGAHTHLPIDEPAPLLGILGSCVELQACATRADIDVLAEHTDDPEQQAELRALTGDDEQSRARYRTTVREPGLSVLDLLERYPACRLPFPVFLDLLPALAPRYYSISSSPLVEPADRAASPKACCSAPARVRRRRLRRRVLHLPAGDGTRQHRLRLHPAAHHPVPAAGGSVRADDHGGRRHRIGPVPRIPAGTGRAEGQRGERWPRRCCSSAAERRPTGCTPTNSTSSRNRRMCMSTRRSRGSRPTAGNTRNTKCSPTRTRSGT